MRMLMCFAVGIWLQVVSNESTFGQQSSGPTLSVMSFNIRYGTANDGDNRWELRRDLVVKTVEDCSPDLLGTQETLRFQADYLQQHLPEHAYFGRSRDQQPDQGEECGIFYLKQRFEMVQSGQFWLSESPDEVASKSWDSSLPRIATWLLLKDKANNNRELLLLNTHFDHRGEQARLESAKLIRKWLEENYQQHPIVITGDFNCGVDSKPYEWLTRQDSGLTLTDTFRFISPERTQTEGTFNGFRGSKDGARIDWVLCSEHFRIESASIVHSNDNERYPSDHFPITSELSWRD